MKYLKKLKIFFQGILVDYRNPFKYRPVHTGEPLARFIVESKYFTREGKVKPSAFAPHSQRLDLSAFRVISATDDAIEYFGNRYVAAPRDKTLFGWAIFNSDVPISLQLKLNPDGKPHKRHLNIENWPSDNLMLRTELANKSLSKKIK